MLANCLLFAAGAVHGPPGFESAAAIAIAAVSVLFWNHLSDRELIRACADGQGDQNSVWSEFIRRFDAWIVHCVQVYCQRWHFDSVDQKRLLDDLAQDVYLRLLSHDRKALRRFKGKGANEFRAYLKVVTRTVVLNHFEKNRRVYDTPAGSGQVEWESHGESPEDVLRWYWELVMRRLRGVESDRNLLVFALNRIEDLSPETIARLPGIDLTPSGVESVIYRILERFASGRPKSAR